MIKPPPENRATQVTDANGREYGGGERKEVFLDTIFRIVRDRRLRVPPVRFR